MKCIWLKTRECKHLKENPVKDVSVGISVISRYESIDGVCMTYAEICKLCLTALQIEINKR